MALTGQFIIDPAHRKRELRRIKTENRLHWEEYTRLWPRQNAKQSAQIKKDSNKMEFFQQQAV
jgi:hypothetical protein